MTSEIDRNIRRWNVINALNDFSEGALRLSRFAAFLNKEDEEIFFQNYPESMGELGNLVLEIIDWEASVKKSLPTDTHVQKETPEPASWNASPAELQEEAEALDWDQKPLELESDE